MDRTSHSSSTGDLPLLPVKRERGNDDDLLKDSPKAKRLNPGSASAGNSRLDPIRMISNKTSSKSLKDNNPAGTSSSAGSPKPILSRDHDKSVHTSDTQLSRQQDALPGISPTRNTPVTQNDGSSLAAGTSATSSPNIPPLPTMQSRPNNRLKQLRGLVFRTGQSTYRMQHIPTIVSDRFVPSNTRIPMFEQVLGSHRIHDCTGWGVDYAGRKRAFIIAWTSNFDNQVNESLLNLYPHFKWQADAVVMQIGTRGEVIDMRGQTSKLLALSALRSFLRMMHQLQE